MRKTYPAIGVLLLGLALPGFAQDSKQDAQTRTTAESTEESRPAPTAKKPESVREATALSRSNIGDGPVHYEQACMSGVCFERIWDPVTQTSGEAMVDSACGGNNCPSMEEIERIAEKLFKDFDPTQLMRREPEPPEPSVPPAATTDDGDTTTIPYEGHTNWKICK